MKLYLVVVLVAAFAAPALADENFGTFLSASGEEYDDNYVYDEANMMRKTIKDLELTAAILRRRLEEGTATRHHSGSSTTHVGADQLNYADPDQGRVKKNYNLDHLARMNFRRAFRATDFNNRHILGGLKK